MSAPGVFDAVRARHSLAGVARRSGLAVGDHGDWMVPCPLPDHHDRTPSMMLHLDTGRYHCFGCEAHGDVIQWVRDIEGARLGEAVHILDSGRPIAAVLAGGARPDHASADARRRSERPDLTRTSRDRIVDAVESAWGYYSCPALHSRALDYLHIRRIDPSALEAETGSPLAGHTPSRPDALTKRMRALGFTDDELVDAGLMLSFPDGRTTDFFRDRLIVPIRDDRGRVVGLIGRRTGPESERRGSPKYLNMPTTATYDKQVAIYRPSRPRLHPQDASVVICEGTLDALAIAAQAATSRLSALYAPVSTSGLSLSATQIASVLAIHPQPPVVAGDGDPCGQTQGSLKWARAFLAAGRQCVVVPWPAGEDPASWIARHGQGGLLAVTRKGCLHSHPGDIRPRHVGEFLTQDDIDRTHRAATDRITKDLARLLDTPSLPADQTWQKARQLAHDLDPAAAASLASQHADVEPRALLEEWNRQAAAGLHTVFDRLASNLASLRSEPARHHYTRAAAHVVAPFVVDVLTSATAEHTRAERLLGQVAHWGARLGGSGRDRYSHAAAGALSATGIGDPFVLERQIQAAIQARIDNPLERAGCFHQPRDLEHQPTC